MINLRMIKKSFYIIVIFLSVTLFGSLSISTIQSIISDSITNGDYTSKSSITCNLVNINEITTEEFLECIKSTSNLYIEKNKLNPGALSGKAIYFDGKPKLTPNIIWGRYFSSDDFSSDVPVAVVGKDILKKAKDIDGKKYFEYENVRYKIIGVIGYENRNSISDMQFIINLNSYIQNSNKISSSNYLINSLDNSNNIFNIFINNLKKYFPEFKYEIIQNKVNNKNLISSLIIDGFNSIIFFIILIALILINIFNITFQWVDDKRKEIGIKKALGGSNFKISFEIIRNYQTISLCSYILGMIIYAIVIKLKIFLIFKADIYFLATFISFILSSFVALIVSMFAIIKALKIPPAIIMKGGKI